MNSNTDSAVL